MLELEPSNAAANGGADGADRLPAAVPALPLDLEVHVFRRLGSNRPIRTFAIGAASLNIDIVAGEAILVLLGGGELGLGTVGFGALFTSTDSVVTGLRSSSVRPWSPWPCRTCWTLQRSPPTEPAVTA